jgi:hypothetical protein
MTEDDVFEKTGQAYLCLIHPVTKDGAYRREIEPVMAISATVPDTLVSSLIVGRSWRERLLGLLLAMTKDPTEFVDRMLAWLRDVRGISIVPGCAALAVLARRGLFDASRLLTGEFDHTVFDGELGWALDIASRYAAGQSVGLNERGPNYGQLFAHQIEMYEHILNGQPGGAANGSQPFRSE